MTRDFLPSSLCSRCGLRPETCAGIGSAVVAGSCQRQALALDGDGCLLKREKKQWYAKQNPQSVSAPSDPRSSRAVKKQLQERRRKTEVRAREKQIRRQKDNTRASDSNHVTQASPDHHDQEKRAESRDKREESSSHGDTPILIQTWFSHLNACPGQAAATEARSEKREEIIKMVARDPQIE